MTRIHSFLLLLATVAPCLGASASTQACRPKPGSNSTAAGFPAGFDGFVESVLKDLHVPGMSVALVNGNQTFTKAYGYAHLSDKKATPDTIWLGASTTKAFVGATLSHFINNKTYPDKLTKGWKTPISDIIPDDFVLTDEWATKHLTLEDAISHQTGLPRHDYAWRYSNANGTERTPIRDVVRTLRHLELVAEPRAAVQYNNLVYITLSHVIETLAGKPLKTVFKELIWEPLGMNSTFLDVDEAKAAAGDRMATGYGWHINNSSFVEIKRDTLQASGAAGIITTVEDHARWLHSLIDMSGPLSKAVHKDIRRGRSIFSDQPWVEGGLDVKLYALGWQRTTFFGEELFFHGGESLAFGTTMWWIPSRKFGAVAMGSVYEHANEASVAVIRRLAAEALDVPPEKRINDLAESIKKMDQLDHNLDTAATDIYPKFDKDNRAPPPAALSALAGTYEDPGYGPLVFKPTSNSSNFELLAERPDMLYQYNVRLEHVSGNDWMAWFESRIASRLPTEVFEAHFTFAGNASKALTINFFAEPKRYNVTFNKVA
ncbi:Beta-lactamase/transpeptidase-like protein [Cordyceps fumosorosea ARSEF 2679]|uniref:Beta-lactamase/transpeptidase-like protein n=1 Tax=Cordyceps fumosorosea (strain ARSEF 2679) TaxID=1081104 RepID=A0A168DCS3_CORFA|nr:Beta-lactamase/transpeptidase-like protein [Cordyceps fumosorosea ARSEF 2679]OAA72447.1 Beta-lactamase/transpeptidase-like protein [Cordyceps fumosorosea ARSEF 2679]